MIACSRCGKNLNDKSRICITCLEECCEDVDNLKQQRDDLREACKDIVDDATEQVEKGMVAFKQTRVLIKLKLIANAKTAITKAQASA